MVYTPRLHEPVTLDRNALLTLTPVAFGVVSVILGFIVSPCFFVWLLLVGEMVGNGFTVTLAAVGFEAVQPAAVFTYSA
jgi:hypothetical protein